MTYAQIIIDIERLQRNLYEVLPHQKTKQRITTFVKKRYYSDEARFDD